MFDPAGAWLGPVVVLDAITEAGTIVWGKSEMLFKREDDGGRPIIRRLESPVR